MAGVAGLRAACAQGQQPRLELLQLEDARADMADVRVEQRVDRIARRLRRVVQRQQHADLAQRHVERTRLADQSEPFDIGRAVAPVAVVLLARRLGQQALALVVADGAHRRAGGAGQFADLHAHMVACTRGDVRA